MLDRRFENCLIKIESADPDTRREGVLALRQFLDSRAMQVLQSLLFDADPSIRALAADGVKTLERVGVRLRLPRSEQLRERIVLTDALDVADEVFCIFRRNAAVITGAAIIAGIVKILIGTIFVAAPLFFESGQAIENSLWGIGFFLFFIHQVFMRPFAWLTVGRAFMGGFLDPEVRQRALVAWNSREYWAFFPVNLVQCLPIITTIWLLVEFRFGLQMLWLLLIFLLWWVHATVPLLPLKLYNSGKTIDTIQQSYSIWLNRAAEARNLLPTFLIQMALMYAVIIINFRTIMPMPCGFDLVQIIGSILLADVVIDPFWIGYRILVTQLLKPKNL